MLTIQGFNIEDFIDYNPPKNTIAISFASKLDHQYDQQLYAKLPDAYAKYLDHLVILADDIPISEPNSEYQLFTNQDAKNVIDFLKLDVYDTLSQATQAAVSLINHNLTKFGDDFHLKTGNLSWEILDSNNNSWKRIQIKEANDYEKKNTKKVQPTL